MASTPIPTVVHDLIKFSLFIDGHADILIPISAGEVDISRKTIIPDMNQWKPGSNFYEKHPLTHYGFSPHTIKFGCQGQYDIPRWTEAGLNIQVCAIYLDDTKMEDPIAAGKHMVNCFHETIQQNPELVLCTTVQDILQAKSAGKIGWVLSLEGCEALGEDLDRLDWYYERGLRIASLTHTRTNWFGEGSWGDTLRGGLTTKGKKLIKKLIKKKVVIDLVHISRKGYWEIIEMVDQPLILSHSTPTMFYSTYKEDRDLLNGLLSRPRIHLDRDREMLKALVKKGGVLGMIWLMYRSIDEAVDDIERAIEIMGEDHIGLGSDLYGQQLATPGLEDISKLPNLINALIARGHSEGFMSKFLGKNYLRVFRQIWDEEAP